MGNNVKVTIEKFDVNWLEIKNMARGTISMEDSSIEPSEEWKKKMLIARHSVLRHSLITVKIENIPYCNMGHFVRHSVGVTPYVSTSREDRTGIKREERKQTDPVTMRLDLNIESLINISEKRLCNQADKTTREIWKEVIYKIMEKDETIAWACIPQGIRTCGCPEMFGTCNACVNMLQGMAFDDRFDMMKRYDYYNFKRRVLIKGDNKETK